MRTRVRPFSFGTIHGFGAAMPAPTGRSRGEILGLPATDFFEVLGPTLAALGSAATLIAFASGNHKTGSILGAGTAIGTAVMVATKLYAEKAEAYRIRQAGA